MGRTLEFQLLAYRVEITVEDDRLESVLAYLVNGAAQPLAPRAVMHYAVTGTGPYRIFEEGDELGGFDSRDDVLYVLHLRTHARLAEYLSLGGWVALHAGLVSIDDRRALVMGAKGTGKTLLSLRLCFDGHAVEGDETVFTRRGEVVCLPRNFHVKPGAPDLVPELVGRWADLPSTSTSDGQVIRAFDLAAQGFPWRLRSGPIGVAFVLRANHGGAAACRPVGALDLAGTAVATALPTGVASRDVVAACATALGAVDGYELSVGDLRETARLLAATVRSEHATSRPA